MASSTIRVRGLRELQRDLKKLGSDVPREVDSEMRDAAEIVATEARELFSPISARSASTFRPRTKGFGRVFVEQRRRKTTGKRGDFGALQMRRALLPALGRKQDEVIKRLDRMLGRLGGEHGF